MKNEFMQYFTNQDDQVVLKMLIDGRWSFKKRNQIPDNLEFVIYEECDEYDNSGIEYYPAFKTTGK